MYIVSAKTQARIDLTGGTGKAFALFLSQILLSAAAGAASYGVRAVTRRYACPAVGAAGQIILLLASAWLVGAVRQGALAWHMRRTGGKKPGFLPVLYWLRRARGMRASLLRAVTAAVRLAETLLLLAPSAVLLIAAQVLYAHRAVSLLCCAASTVGGAVGAAAALVFAGVLAQRYALASFLLAKDPHRKLREVLRESKTRTAGRLVSLYAFKLSFLPWFVSCLLIVPLIYTVPYYRQCRVCRMERVYAETAHPDTAERAAPQA